jgi:hypothetical protein
MGEKRKRVFMGAKIFKKRSNGLRLIKYFTFMPAMTVFNSGQVLSPAYNNQHLSAASLLLACR